MGSNSKTYLTNKRYIVDFSKLSKAVDSKRRMHKHTIKRISVKLGVSETTLNKVANYNTITEENRITTLDSHIFIAILMYLNRPAADFIIDKRKGENLL